MIKPLKSLQLSINGKNTPPSVLELINELLDQSLDIRLAVSGKSMSPALQDNYIVTLRKADTSSLKQGDLILYLDSWKQLVLHRLIRKFTDNNINWLQTSGDALQIPDMPIEETQALAVVQRIEIPDGKSLNLTLMSQQLYARLNAWHIIRRIIKRRLFSKLRPILVRT